MNGTLLAILGVAVFCFLASFAFAKVAEDSAKQGPYFVAPTEIANSAAGCLLIAGLMVAIGFTLLVYFAWGCNIWPWEPAVCVCPATATIPI